MSCEETREEKGVKLKEALRGGGEMRRKLRKLQ